VQDIPLKSQKAFWQQARQCDTDRLAALEAGEHTRTWHQLGKLRQQLATSTQSPRPTLLVRVTRPP